MSTRTIIEINHDHLAELRRDSYPLHRLLLDLAACDLSGPERDFLRAMGIRVLGQRHHSEPEWEQGRPPTKQEDAFLRRAAREAGKVVAPGRLAAVIQNTAVDERMAAQNSESVDGYVQGDGIDAALAAPGIERLREWAASGPVQRAAVEEFAIVLGEHRDSSAQSRESESIGKDGVLGPDHQTFSRDTPMDREQG